MSVEGCAQSSSRRPETRHQEPDFLLLLSFVAPSQQVAEGGVEGIKTKGKRGASKSNVILSYSAIKLILQRGETSRRNAREAGWRVAHSCRQSLTS